MSIHQKYERWIGEYLEPRFPELVAPFLAALDAYDVIQERSDADPAQLQPLLHAARSHREPLYENAVGLIANLTREHQLARDAVMEMSSDRKAQVRFNAVLCLGRETPKVFCVEILGTALADKSSRVRVKAADWARHLGLAELVPDLEEAVRRESQEKTRQSIEFHLRLLRDGYIIEESNDGRVSITIQRASGAIAGKNFSRTEFDKKGRDAIIDELQSGWP